MADGVGFGIPYAAPDHKPDWFMYVCYWGYEEYYYSFSWL